jgi:hypothetical protein
MCLACARLWVQILPEKKKKGKKEGGKEGERKREKREFCSIDKIGEGQGFERYTEEGRLSLPGVWKLPESAPDMRDRVLGTRWVGLCCNTHGEEQTNKL